MSNNSKSILDYKGVIQGLTQDLARLETYAEKLEMENCAVTLKELNEHVRDNRFNLAVLGEFRRGKSTLINALLHTPVLPSDIVPTTASVNRVTYIPDRPRARVDYLNGATEDIDIDDLAMYATQEGKKSSGVRQVTVWYPTPYCANNVDIYDTPGLNDSDEMTHATMEVMSRMDAAIFVLMANVPLGQSEIDFLSNRLLTADVGRVLFVVTRMDEFTSEQQQRVLNNIRQRIETYILEKAEKVYANDADKLANFKSKLGDVQIFGVSSTMALKGRQEHDDTLLEKSGFRAFESAIDDLLIRERGLIMLQQQTGSIAKAAADIFSVIQTRLAPLTVSEEEFKAGCEKAEAEIAQIQKELTDELARLDSAAENITEKVKADWASYIAELEEKITDAVKNEISLPKAALSKSQREAAISSAWEQYIAPLIASELQIYSEKITEEINAAAQQECQNLSGYIEQLSKHLSEIRLNLSFEKTTVGETVRNTIYNYCAFGGSFLEGYKIAGLKGAMVGGLSGAAINVGVTFAALTALVLLTGGLTAPLIIISSVTGAFGGLVGGKAIVKAAFKKDRIERMKDEIIRSASKTLREIALGEGIQQKLIDYVHETIESIQKAVANKTNATITDLAAALQNTQKNYAAEKARSQQRLEDYKQILESISKIADNAQRVRWEYGLD